MTVVSLLSLPSSNINLQIFEIHFGFDIENAHFSCYLKLVKLDVVSPVSLSKPTNKLRADNLFS